MRYNYAGNNSLKTAIGTQSVMKMRKAQTQTSKEKETALIMTNIKLREQVNELKCELKTRMKQYSDDILGYNIKLNELEELLDKKEAENSSEIIKLLSKISKLEETLQKKQAEDKQLQDELNYRANKLDEYELKIHKLQEAIGKLEYQRDRDLNNKFETLQQTLENKSERTLKYLGDILSTFQLKEYKSRESETKTPAAMESLIKMWQKSDEQCKILMERNSKLDVVYQALMQQISVLKLLLYENINSRCHFHTSLAKMFEITVTGLLNDLKSVLPRLSHETLPTSKECQLQIQFLNIETVKYQNVLNDLKFFRLRIEEIFTSNDITSKMETIPELTLFIPASILHVRYLGMWDLLREQNQLNLFQTHLAYQQQFKGIPLSLPPNTNSIQSYIIPQIPALQMGYSKTESPVVIEESSNRSIRPDSSRSAQSENSTISSNCNVQFGKVSNSSAPGSTENLSHQNQNIIPNQDDLIENNSMQATIKTEVHSPQSNYDYVQLKIKPFKLSSKTKEFIPTSVLAKRVFENRKIEVTASSAATNNEDITSTKSLENAVFSCHNESAIQCDLLVKPESIDNDCVEDCNLPLKNSDTAAVLNSDSNKVGEADVSSPQLEKRELPENHFEPIQEIASITETSDCNFIESSRSASRNIMETMDGQDITIIEKLGGKNNLVKLYFFVKYKAKIDLLNITDEELVNAILAVKQKNTLKGMRKNDILRLIMDFLKKQKETESENKAHNNKFCAICFENNNEPSKTLPCEHTFHNDCLEHWFQRDNICPVCRKLVVTVDDLN